MQYNETMIKDRFTGPGFYKFEYLYKGGIVFHGPVYVVSEEDYMDEFNYLSQYVSLNIEDQTGAFLLSEREQL